MIFEFKLPKINPLMTTARLECVHLPVGTSMKPGDKFIDLSVDLSSAFSQDCPPVSYYRVIIRERVVLRALTYAAGDSAEVADLLALFTSDADEPIDGAPARAVRFATAGIVRHAEMWSGRVL